MSPARRYLLLALPLAASMVAIAGCGGSPSQPSTREPKRVIARPSNLQAPDPRAGLARAPATRAAGHDGAAADDPLMSPGLHAAPDPAIRLYALEAWALKPGPTLDPVTYALVDPDASVRTRAQEILEELLERRQ